MVSPTPGLISQITGKLNTKRYMYATVYIDQFSGLGYVHLQKTATADETLEGKEHLNSMHKIKGLMCLDTMLTMAYSGQINGF